MSIESWKEQFYPCSAKEVARRGRNDEPYLALSCTRHSLRKWIGLRPENLKRHGLATWGGLWMAAGDSCALCEAYLRPLPPSSRIVRKCVDCPLDRSELVSCFGCVSAWKKACDGKDPEPMIAALRRTEEMIIEKGWPIKEEKAGEKRSEHSRSCVCCYYCKKETDPADMKYIGMCAACYETKIRKVISWGLGGVREKEVGAGGKSDKPLPNSGRICAECEEAMFYPKYFNEKNERICESCHKKAEGKHYEPIPGYAEAKALAEKIVHDGITLRCYNILGLEITVTRLFKEENTEGVKAETSKAIDEVGKEEKCNLCGVPTTPDQHMVCSNCFEEVINRAGKEEWKAGRVRWDIQGFITPPTEVYMHKEVGPGQWKKVALFECEWTDFPNGQPKLIRMIEEAE